MPEHLTEEEWDQRQKDWDKVFFGLGIPSECGFLFEPTSSFIIPQKSLYKFPSFEERLDYASKEMATDYYKNEILKNNPEITVREFKKLLSEKDIDKKAFEFKEDLKEKLVKEIKFQDTFILELK